MKLFYDLHIHSSLSPCADDDMTPANICGMAHLKGLDLIAVTDHNAADNLPFIKQVADSYDLLLLPGIEVTTKEEVHLLGYFPRVEDAVKAGRFFKSRLPKMKNRPAYFGNQHIINAEDERVAVEEALLVGATDLSLSACAAEIEKRGGICIPAHINRGVNGILTNLGFIPDNLKFNTLEVSKGLKIDNATITGKGILHSSDAHCLGNISERENVIMLEKKCVESAFSALQSGHF
jgi:Predicted metal-dependent phosphoesterases (PHP family)